MEGERGGGRRPRREAGDGERRRDGATAEKREWGMTEGPEATRVDRGRGGEERRGGGEGNDGLNREGGSSAKEAADVRGRVKVCRSESRE